MVVSIDMWYNYDRKDSDMMAYTEAAKKATIKYQKKAYDRLELKVKKGEKEKIQSRAAELGISVNAYISQLIQQDIEKI